MDITKGLHMDFHESNQPAETYRWAINWVAENFDSLTTELGNSYVNSISVTAGSPLDRGFIPVGFIAKQNAFIGFFINETSGISEIGVYFESNQTYTTYLQDARLNFNKNHTVRGLSKSNNQGDWVVVFNDRHESVKIITIDIVALTLTKYYPSYDISQLELFQTTKFTTFTSNIVVGGSLPVAPYIPFIQYERLDGTVSSCYTDGKIRYIDKQTLTSFEVGELGSITSKAITVTFAQDANWYKVNIGLANLQTTEVLIISSRAVTSGNVTVTLPTFSGITLAGGLDNINILKANYTKAQAQTSHQGYLYLGGVSTSKVIIPQSVVNTLSLKWVCKWVKAHDYLPSTTLKSFQPNEVYSFTVRFWKDGRVSDWYHLKGREPKAYKTLYAPETYAVNDTPEINLVTSSLGSLETDAQSNTDTYQSRVEVTGTKVFQTNDCIDYNSPVNPVTLSTLADGTTRVLSGEMSYWENTSETYNLYFKGSDLNVGASVNALNNKNVRYHKMPSKHFLNLAINKAVYGSGLPTANQGTNTNVLYSNKPQWFIDRQPQLGVQLIESAEFTAWLATQGITFDRIELGHSQRDINNNTVISEDLAHFGVYGTLEGTPTGGLFAALPASYTSDALGFTGGNFNSQTAGLTPCYSTSPNSTLRFNGDFLEGGQDTPEVMPNRQRLFNPEIYNDNDFINALNISPTFIKHEVLLSTFINVVDSQNYGGTPTFVNQEDSSSYEGLGTFPRYQYTFPATMHTYQAGVATYGGTSLGRHYRYIFDYTLSGNVAYDKTKGNIPTTYPNLDVNGSITAVAGQGVIYAKSDFTYPTRYSLQNIDKSEYINRGTNYSLDGTNLNSAARLIAYGGNNHLNLKIKIRSDSRFSLPVSIDQKKWYRNSLIKNESYLSLPTGGFFGNISYFFTPFNPFGAKVTSEIVRNKYQNNTFISTLLKYNPSIYSQMGNIPIELCETEALDTSSMYVGDVFISEVNYLVNGFGAYNAAVTTAGTTTGDWGGAGINSCVYRFFAHTRKNQSQRKAGTTSLTAKNSFYPIASPDSFYFETNQVLPQQYNLDEDWNTNNLNYSSSILYDSFTSLTNAFPYRILQSSINVKESNIENWSNFPILNYYEIDKIKGVISNLQGYDEQLIIQTVNALLITKASTQLKTGTFSIVLGTSSIFDFPPNEIMLDNDAGGFLGTKHQGSCLLTPFGYIFYDSDRRRLYSLAKDDGIKEISVKGLRLFFEKYGTVTENDFTSNLAVCNTYYDNKFRRIIFTFRSAEANRYFTISYYPESDNWKSFHHYTPKIAFNTKNNYYGVDLTNKLIKFNQNLNSSAYSQAFEESIIDTVFNTMPINTKSGVSQGGKDELKLIQSFNWKTEVRDGSLENYNIIENDTFTSAGVRTNKQVSKEANLIFGTNIRKYNNLWQFNSFRDATVRNTNGNPTAGNVVNTVVGNFTFVGNTEPSPVKRFVDSFGVLKLKYLLNGNKRLTLFNLDWLTQKTNK